MKNFLKLVQADIKMTLREREALFWMFLFPILMMLILGFVFGRSGDFKLEVGIVDHDNSLISKAFTKGFESVDAIKMFEGDEKKELEELKDGNRDAVLILQKGLGDSIMSGRPGTVFLYIDESDVNTAQIARSTLGGMLVNKVRDMAAQHMGGVPNLLTIKEKKVEAESFDYLDFMVPGILAMTLMFSGLMGLNQEYATYREKGILRRIKVSPLPLSRFMGSGITSVLLFSLVQAAILLVIGILVFKIKIAGNYLNIAILVLIGCASFLALGFMIAALSHTTKGSQLASSAVAMPMMFLAGIFFPIQFVPTALAVIARCLPLYYFGDALREVMIRGKGLGAVWLDIVVLVGMGLICFAISVKLFRWE
jgi:ABC-2 type transport system permease protein